MSLPYHPLKKSKIASKELFLCFKGQIRSQERIRKGETERGSGTVGSATDKREEDESRT